MCDLGLSEGGLERELCPDVQNLKINTVFVMRPVGILFRVVTEGRYLCPTQGVNSQMVLVRQMYPGSPLGGSLVSTPPFLNRTSRVEILKLLSRVMTSGPK